MNGNITKSINKLVDWISWPFLAFFDLVAPGSRKEKYEEKEKDVTEKA